VLAIVAGLHPAVLSGFFKGKVVVSSMETVAWLLLTALLWVIFLAFNRVFPPASLVIRDQESWVKRHTPELTVILGLATLVVAVLTFLFK
jgi:F0F1-type ATP synthase membrane subunit a